MEIIGTLKDGVVETLELSGARANASLEVRMQNTMNGQVTVQYVQAAITGPTSIPVPLNFGQHMAISIRTLPDDTVFSFYYPADQEPDKLRLVTPDASATSPTITVMGVHADIAPNAT
jgi:hypothetical protein